MFADRLLVAFASEITGERLFANNVFSSLHGIDNHSCMQHRRRADIDEVKIAVSDQIAKISVRRGDLMFLGKIDDLGASCGNCADFHLKTINALICIHMQLGDKAAPDKAHFHFCHPALLNLACPFCQRHWLKEFVPPE